ncbi:hypothetical protein DPMN_121049 [Dreissena polymorpha]|uniref:Uncharacterized protein n=1 Tax=Dreissena polymorpha TaxID=45954 RepID=A0A9D4GKZ7_DREPO|nr:hypothetical protein DPMN_121049 [Dreissena polymorpha]
MKVVKPLGTNPSRAPTGKFLSIVGPILQLGLDDPANAPRAHYVGAHTWEKQVWKKRTKSLI